MALAILIGSKITKGLIVAYLISAGKFLKYEKYSTMVKNADIEMKIIRGGVLSETAHGVNILYTLGQIALAII